MVTNWSQKPLQCIESDFLGAVHSCLPLNDLFYFQSVGVSNFKLIYDVECGWDVSVLLGLCEKMLIFDDVIKKSDDVIKSITVQNYFRSLSNKVSFC